MRPYRDGDSELKIVPLIAALEQHGVHYVAVGSTAAIIQGVDLVLTDLDIVPAVDLENLKRLAKALAEMGALEKRGKDSQLVSSLINDPTLLLDATFWTFTTNYGEIDLVLRPAGFEGGYVALIDRARTAEVWDDGTPESVVRAVVADVADVYRSKRKAARPKDIRVLSRFRGIHPIDNKELARERYRADQLQRTQSPDQPNDEQYPGSPILPSSPFGLRP